MGFWVVDNSTGAIRDYSADGSINYDLRFYTTRQAIDLPIGDQPIQYRWDGAQIVRLPAPLPNPLLGRIDAVLASPLVPQVLKDLLTVWRAQL